MRYYKEILERVIHVGGKIPKTGKYLIIAIQKNKNVFDDEFYVFDGNVFIMSSTGTTDLGNTVSVFFEKCKLIDSVVWKTDQFIEDCFVPGFHKTKMKALRINKPISFHLKGKTKVYNEYVPADMHGVDYDPFTDMIKENINGWSFACQVWNRISDYRVMANAVWRRNKPVDYCLLKEWQNGK